MCQSLVNTVPVLEENAENDRGVSQSHRKFLNVYQNEGCGILPVYMHWL